MTLSTSQIPHTVIQLIITHTTQVYPILLRSQCSVSDPITLTIPQLQERNFSRAWCHVLWYAGGYPGLSMIMQIQVLCNASNANTSISVSTGNANPSTNNTGGGGSHENRPPYYALCYIMKS